MSWSLASSLGTGHKIGIKQEQSCQFVTENRGKSFDIAHQVQTRKMKEIHPCSRLELQAKG